MAKKDLNKIFLSASIPYPERDRKYYESADIVAIRDAVRALATVVIPKAHLIWGGHPSITPLIRFVMERLKVNVNEHITLYQSLFYKCKFPKDNDAIEKIRFTPKGKNEAESLSIMRNILFRENKFKAAIFIGGMEGINEEYKLFIKENPNALVLPIASTGAAANILYEKLKKTADIRLATDYAYMALFRDLLSKYINN
jgi:hypothetical protein